MPLEKKYLNSRYLSLDVFRGLDIALMIIVNSPGQGSTTYRPLLHADWNGFTLTDLVFPTFLFLVGTSMSFSFQKFTNNKAFIRKVFTRSFTIFVLGFLMYWFPFFEEGHLKPLSNTRIFGVLQRIALAYFFASLIVRYVKGKQVFYIGIGLLFLYQIILFSFGDLSLLGNAVVKLDLALFGPNHLYQGEGVPFDPEGLLSTIPAISNVIFGYLAGLFLQKKGSSYNGISKLLMVGFLFAVAGLAWNLNFPINKKLWTSSFVLLSTGIDLMILGILVFVIDKEHLTKWTKFFLPFGRNPLFIYLLSELFVISLYSININGQSAYSWIAENIFIKIFGDYNGSLAFAIWVMLCCWAVALYLDKRKIYIKV